MHRAPCENVAKTPEDRANDMFDIQGHEARQTAKEERAGKPTDKDHFSGSIFRSLDDTAIRR